MRKCKVKTHVKIRKVKIHFLTIRNKWNICTWRGLNNLISINFGSNGTNVTGLKLIYLSCVSF